MKIFRLFKLLLLLLLFPSTLYCQTYFRVMEWNVENLFDTVHDSLKNDNEFLPNSMRHWNKTKYWDKLNKIGKTIAATSQEDAKNYDLPDLIGLCEVENDSTMIALAKRSLLRTARYEYVMTSSPDIRGIDVALLYSPFSFRLLNVDTIRIVPLTDMRPTRDILYVKGELQTLDTLHVFLVHFPSRRGGEMLSKSYRIRVADKLSSVIDSVRLVNKSPKIIVLGDFNDYADGRVIKMLESNEMRDISKYSIGINKSKGTYKYKAEWGSLDHIIISTNLLPFAQKCYIFDPNFLLEKDTRYGGTKPYRTYNGIRYNRGYSDHLPLILDLKIGK